MDKPNYQELFQEAFSEMHNEGNEWLYLPDVAQRAASHDETYMKRRLIINKALGSIGINRPELPHGIFYPPKSGLYHLISNMESQGIVESIFEEGESPRCRLYR